MARAGGGGGGGRSFGGGGGRSFGGRSGGGSFNRGGVSGGSSGRGGGGFGGGFGGPRGGAPRMPPVFRAPHVHVHRPFGGWGGGGFGGPRGPVGPRRGCGCTSLISILVVAVVLLFVVYVFSTATSLSFSSGSSAVTKSTVVREPLPRGSVVETDYYTDELGWINNKTALLTGMKNFYQATGVQPYLYITDAIAGSNNPTESIAEAFAIETYDALFEDEAHLLLIFHEYNEQYGTWYLCGAQAKAVLDDEAMDILLDYIDRYYYSSELTDEEFFSKAFDEAGKRIMTVTKSPWIPVVWVIVAVLAVTVLFVWWRSLKKQKNLEAEHMERVLNTPLNTFGNAEAEDLSKKYDGPDKQ